MATNKRQVLIRVQPENYEKIKYISDQNHRSVSNQLEWLMLQYIADYEKQNGEITSPTILQQNQSGANFIAYGGKVTIK